MAQFAGGECGAKLLEALSREGIAELTVPIGEDTRTCTTVIDEAGQGMTELIEPPPHVSADQAARLASRIAEALPRFHGVALCGTCPPGTPNDFFAAMIQRCRGKMPVLLDSFQGIQAALEQHPDILKINDHEVNELTACGKAIGDGARRLAEQFKIPFVAITAGANTACLANAAEIRFLSLPMLEHVLNPLGAGDTATAVLLAGVCRAIHQGKLTFPFPPTASQNLETMGELFADALAAASASCLDSRPACYCEKAAKTIRKRIRCEAKPNCALRD